MFLSKDLFEDDVKPLSGQVPASSGAGGAGVSSSVGLPQYAGGGSVGSTSYRGDGEDAMTRQQKLQQQRAMMQRKMGGGGAVTQSYGLIRSNQGFGGNQGLSPEEPSQPRRKSTADLFEVPEPTRPSFSEDPPAPPPDPSTAGTTSSTFDNNASGAPAAATILSSAPSCEVEVDTTSDVISEAGSDFNEMNPQFHGGNSDAPVAIDDTELPVVEAVSPVQLQNDHLSPKHTEYQLQSRGLASVFDPCASTNTQSGSLYSGGGNPMGDPLANSLSLGARRFLPSMIGPSLPQFLMNRLPRGVLMECYVTRSGGLASKFYPKYKMFTEQGAFFLMSSQKRKKNKTSNYCISMGENDLNPQGVNCLGKLRSNFMGSEFVAYSNGLNPNKGGNRRPEDYREELCAITYSSTIWGRLSVTGKKPRGPRQMNVIIPKLRQPDDQPIVCRPLHANDAGLLSAAKSFGVVPGGGSSSSSNGAPSAPPSGTNGFQPNTTAQGNVMMQPNGAMQHLSGVDGGMSSSAHHSYNNANNPLQQLHQAPIDVYQNKAPKWNDQLGAFVLNFNKRVTQASVKNFQLVSAHDPDTVLLQFGRVGKDTFNMDFRYPLSPYQAFAIVLSSFDYKLCCE